MNTIIDLIQKKKLESAIIISLLIVCVNLHLDNKSLIIECNKDRKEAAVLCQKREDIAREEGRKESLRMFNEYMKVTDKNLYLLEIELNKRK